MTDTEDNSFDDRPEPPSKTKRKQEMHALQDIGEQLVGLNKDRLAQINLPETLLDAVIEAKRLTGHEARRRQMQYLGKLMRSVDEDPIRAKLDEWNNVTRVQGAKFHALERWRERLLTEEQALSDLVAEALRAEMTRREGTRAAKPFMLVTYGRGGPRPGINLDKTSELLEIGDKPYGTP